ncbi:MAG: fumarylacetoacetate hydrolase family protein [Balneolaceae bacterium]|nr:fumarylacetoacetate hydrolase family protein [Balneolaceae bacterium]
MSMLQLPNLDGLAPGSIYCIGRNYAEHARELQNEVPDRPLVFLKPRSSLIGDGGEVVLPAASREVHHEVELVAAIAKAEGSGAAGWAASPKAGANTGASGWKNVPEHEALRAVAGYAVGIDVTARDLQQQAKEKGHPWTVAKGYDTFAPLGSFVPSEEVPDPQKLQLSLTVNGQTRQEDSTSLMLFPVARLIAYLSSIFTLMPGDLVFTGTPKGVSPLEEGDRIVAELEGGRSRVAVTARRESP